MNIKIGIIGTGTIGADHARRITQILTGAEIIALTDVNLTQAKKVKTNLGLNATIFEDGHSLITKGNIDAVLVTSWGDTHEEYVLAAMRAGKYVFCEKPLATTTQSCQNIVDAEISLSKRLVQVGFMRSYDFGYKMLKDIIYKGDIGTPLMIHAAHRNQSVSENYTTPMVIHDTLIHELDIFRWLLNDEYVSTQVIFPRKSSYAHSKVTDPQIVLLETRQGVRIDVELFVNCRYGYDIQCAVVGEEGVANLPEPQTVTVRKKARLGNKLLVNWKERFINSYNVELQDFIKGVQAKKLMGPSSWNGLAAAVSVDACVRAQKSGQIEIIKLPERPIFYR